MKIKKLLSLGLAATMLLALTACGGEDTQQKPELTPYELVKQGSDRLDAMDGVAYELTTQITMDDNLTAGTETPTVIYMDMDGTMKQVKVPSDDGINDYQLYFDMSMTVPVLEAPEGEITTNMLMYYTDGYMYYNIPDYDQKYKMAMDMTDAMAEMQGTNLDEIEEDMILDSSVTERDGGKMVKMTLDGSKMTNLIDEYAANVVDTADEQMVLQDMPYTVYLDADNNITAIEMELKMTACAAEETVNIDMDMRIDVTETEGVTIDFPNDLDTYPELMVDPLMAN
ncbi:MAG: hypothetical protein IJB67_06515 [Firmicutes bacterium]|nr:hypothetical protein [Bacillota bacterium]